MDEYNKVVALYDRLCENRNNNKFWAENITEASENITCNLVWQNFYAYLANGDHVFTSEWRQSLGEQVDSGLTFKEGDQKFKTVEVRNGNVTYIKLTPTNKKQDAEQMDIVPQGIQEEKSDVVLETGDEIGQQRVSQN